MISVAADTPNFEGRSALLEEYCAQAAVLDVAQLAVYRTLWGNHRPANGADALERAIGRHLDHVLPPEGIQVGVPPRPVAALLLEDHRRSYQTFHAARQEVQEVYLAFGHRTELGIPVRIEIDQFFNWLRETDARGDGCLTRPVSRAAERRARTHGFVETWFRTDRPYLHDGIVPAFDRIDRRLRDPDVMARATMDALIDALLVCHAFREQLRFHLGGLQASRDAFAAANELPRVEQSFTSLLHGRGDFVARMGAVIFDSNRRLALCGGSVVQELLGWVNAGDVPICKGRTLKVLRFLGYDVRAE